MADEAWKISHKSPLEQFLLLAKSAKSSAAAQLIRQVTEAPGVYFFGELLEMPNIAELSVGEYKKDWDLLNLFAFGNYKDYEENISNFPTLNPVQITKLRHLTIIALASSSRHIAYRALLCELGMKSVRELEDLIIEAVYAGVILGKLDQQRQQLEIEFVIGRDIKSETIDEVVNALDAWCTNCDGLLQNVQTHMQRSNNVKENSQRMKKQIEAETENLKKAIKAQTSEMSTEDADSSSMYQGQQFPKTHGKQAKVSSLATVGEDAHYNSKIPVQRKSNLANKISDFN
eukprot:gene15261-16836_t